MSWVGWALLVLGLLALFAVWDLVLCGGRYCRRFGELFSAEATRRRR